MSGLTGTGALLRLALRRDRVVVPAWVLGMTVLVLGTAASFAQLLATPEERASFIAGIGTNPGFRALYGPAYDLSTVGGATAWRIGSSAAVLTALMSLLLVVRHTRAEEEAGRTELVGAGRVGRSAGFAAALLVAALADLAVAALVALGLVALGEPAGGALALGLAMASTGLVFAGVAGLCAQVAGTARAASGSAGALLAVAFLVRAVGDLAGSWLGWLSPFGWSIQVRPFAGDRLGVLLLPAALAVLLAAGAAVVAARRDLGAGLIADRAGRAHAPAGLRGTWGLTRRLQRGLLLGWLLGAVAVGALTGALTRDVAELLADNPQLSDVLARSGGSERLVDAYRSSIIGLLGVVAAAFAVQAVLRLRAEEVSGRAEVVLAAPVPRRSWALPALAEAALGAAVLLLAASAAMAVTDGLRSGGVGATLPRLLAAGAAQVPATWVLAAAAFALVAAVPRFAALGWALLGVSVLIGQLGQPLRWPAWLLDASPFQHVPQLPFDEVSVLPSAVLVIAALALAALGLAGLRRRDVLA